MDGAIRTWESAALRKSGAREDRRVIADDDCFRKFQSPDRDGKIDMAAPQPVLAQRLRFSINAHRLRIGTKHDVAEAELLGNVAINFEEVTYSSAAISTGTPCKPL